MDALLEGRWPRSSWPGWRTVFTKLARGAWRDDGTIYMSRRRYATWVWAAFVWKWLRAPLACKCGRHLIGPGSSTGIGCGCAGGTMDVWCLRCDAALVVPIDDAVGREGSVVLDLWRRRPRG